MNKVVIMLFLIIVGGVLIGVPLWGAFHPKVIPAYEGGTQNVNASVDENAIAAGFANTVWTISHNLNIDAGNGQVIPIVFDFEFHFQPNEKLLCKAHLYADAQLPPNYESLKALIETGWEGIWRVRGKGEYIWIKIDNPFRGFNEFSTVDPLRMENIKIAGDTLLYNPTGQMEYSIKKF